MLVDFHIHYTPKRIVEEKLKGNSYKLHYSNGVPAYSFHPKLYDLEALVNGLKMSNVDMAFLSSAAGLEGDLETCRMLNDDLKAQEEKFAGRIKGLAHIPPLGGKEALSELERAVAELGFKGAAIASNIRGMELDSKELWPFYEKVQELGVFLFVHPSLALQQADYFNAYDIARSVGREFGLVVCLIRMINGGVFDAFPSLRVVMSHLGGGISALLGRILSYQDKEFWGTQHDSIHGKTPIRPFKAYFEQIFFDTGGVVGDVDAVKFALAKFPGQLVFGSDYPQEIRNGETLKEFVEGLYNELSPQELRQLEKNVQKVIGE